MKKEPIYLDYNATTPLRPEAWEIMSAILGSEAAYNASSVHCLGRAGRKYIENARGQVANLVGSDTNQVIFNSGATEGNNTILLHFAKKYPNDTILIVDGQHPSIMQSINILGNVKIIPIDCNGIVKTKELETLLGNNKVSLVSCTYANGETGAIQNVSELSDLTHKHGALLHCDGSQAAGRIPLNIKESNIDFLTLSAHKIGGAQGVGALIIGICGQSPTLLFGGGQENYMRSGTQNIAGIASFGAASGAALKCLGEYQRIENLRDKLENKLKELSPDIIIHSKDAPRIPNTSFFSIPSIIAQNILIALDLAGIAISNGSACSSGSVKPSQALMTMGLDKKIASNSLRISMGWATKDSDIDIFLNEWENIIRRVTNKG